MNHPKYSPKSSHLNAVDLGDRGGEGAVVDEFTKARWHALFQDMLAPLRGVSADLLPFEDIRRKLGLDSQTFQGVKDVALDQIVGSVGRYREFSRAFLPRNDALRDRWENILALQGDLPPVDLYKVGDAYFVADGNHRVSVARQAGARTISARVWEFRTRVPLGPEMMVEELLVKEEYVEFLDHTHLDQSRPEQVIEFTSVGGYRELERQIGLYQIALSEIDGLPLSYEEAAAYWYDMIYTPIIQIICQKEVLRGFPRRTEADLFVWITKHQQELSDAYGLTVPMADATDDVKDRRGIKWTRRSLLAIKERLLGPSRRPRSSCDT
jgi:hypothetical protein